MSFNKSKAEKSKGQLRRPGRSGSFGQHSSSNPASLSSSRSSQKSGNVQGGCHRVNPANAGPGAGAAVPSSVVNQAFHNGAHLQAPTQDTLAVSGSKPVEVPRSSRAPPKASSSQSATVASDSAAPVTPAKGNGSKQFTLQFGTITPRIMKGMQIPARTSSAPPNLDEQKSDQALLHQGQALGFAPQMGRKLPPQLGNMGIPIGQRFAQQQSGKFGGQRRAVKITHPETHEELRLDRKDSYTDGTGLNVIDLCSSDDNTVDLGDHFGNSASLDVKIQRKEIRVEEDCYILEPDDSQSLATDLEHKVAISNDSEEDVCIISEKGQVACRDYPHPRHLCAQYPFNSTNHENFCTQCYCYVCDERAPCDFREGQLGHCHASDKEHKWIDLRAVCRLKRKI